MEGSDPGAQTEVDPLRGAVPGDDLEARRARASVARGLFGPGESVDPVDVGRYRIEARRGAGGMGVVYEAWDPELERRVAVKLLHPEVSADETARGRMLREARALARLSDPNVIQVYDVGTTHDQVFVAMEFVEGKTLGEWLSAGPQPWAETLDTFLAAGKGLGAAHAVGLVHRDFKPDNVLIGDDGRVRVLDFGLARAAPELDAAATGQRPISITEGGLGEVSPSLKAALTQTGALVGTPLYMSPEQFEGRAADALSDQYSYCVSLYQGLYGQRPFNADSIAALVRNVVGGRILPPPANTDVPSAIENVLRRGMSLEPGDRYPSMLALIDALRAGREAAAVAIAPSRSPSRRGWVIGLVAVLGLGSAAALAAVVGDDEAGVSRAAAVGASDAASLVGPEPEPSMLTVESAGEVSGAESTHEAPGETTAETGLVAPAEGDSADGEPSSPVTEPRTAKHARDFCFIHEDTYALIRRGPKRQSNVKATDGQCYACRSEKRQNRIERFGYNCGGYFVCGTTDATKCK